MPQFKPGQFKPGQQVQRIGPTFEDKDRHILIKHGEIYTVVAHNVDRHPYGVILEGFPKNFTFTMSQFAPIKEEDTMSDTTANVIRILSTGPIISSATFGKLAAAKQTEILATAMASGKPPVFVTNFTQLADTKKLADRLLAGDDVSMELEFNDITVSDDERDGLNKVRPLLERLNALKSVKVDEIDIDALFGKKAGDIRNWMTGNLPRVYNISTNEKNNLLRRNTSGYIETLSGESIRENLFKSYYPRFLKALENGTADGVTISTIEVGYSNRQLKLRDGGQTVQLGCQKIPTSEVLRIGKELGL